jgi:peroxiredoxin
VYCSQQLAGYQKKIADFEAIAAGVVALSVDSRKHARETVERHGLTFPVLHGLDARDTAEKIGAYINQEANPAFLHTTDFILAPDGTIAQIVYSSGLIGGFVVGEAVAYIKNRQKKR